MAEAKGCAVMEVAGVVVPRMSVELGMGMRELKSKSCEKRDEPRRGEEKEQGN